MDVLSNHVTGTITPYLPSETKSGLWKTSTVPIKKMREVFYVLYNLLRKLKEWSMILLIEMVKISMLKSIDINLKSNSWS